MLFASRWDAAAMSDVPVPEPRSAPGDPDQAGPTSGSVTPAEPPRCATRTRHYLNGRLVESGFAAEHISDILNADTGSFVWLDLDDPDEQDLGVVVQEFGLHPLAVEDAVHDGQRPKLDRYRTHLFANMYAVHFSGETGLLTSSEVSAFIMPRALITVRKAPFDVDALEQRWDDSGDLVNSGVGFLVHGLFDAIVDGQYRAVQDLDDAVDELENTLFDPRPGIDVRRRGFDLRKGLVGLRRTVGPMREVIGRFMRTGRDLGVVPEALVPYFQDVFDHVLLAAEDAETARDLITSILDTNLNEQSNQLNEITKKLAGWAAIIAVPTAVTGFYGQNVPYPGFSKEWGFAVSTATIVVLGGGLYAVLRRRGWL